MTKKEIIAKAKSLLKKNGTVKMIARCGDYQFANALWKVKLELNTWDEGEDLEVIDVQ